MKIAQVQPKFTPVTLTFETKEELIRFVQSIGDLPISDNLLPIPYLVWDSLAKICDGVPEF